MQFYTSLLLLILSSGIASGCCQTVAALQDVPESGSVAPGSENGTEVLIPEPRSANVTEKLSNDTDTLEDLDLVSTSVSIINGTGKDEDEGVEVDTASLLLSTLFYEIGGNVSLSSVEETALELRTNANSTANEMETNTTSISTGYGISVDEQLSTESQVEVLDDHNYHK